MAIFLSLPGQRPTGLNPDPAEIGSDLQRLVAESPECLLVDDLEGVKLHVIGREFPTNSGPIDVLAVDSRGVLHVVETKLSKNPDKRVVVAQVLDYGAALWAAAERADFLATLSAFVRRQGPKPLLERVCGDLALTEDDAKRLVDSIASNTARGVVRFLVVMNRLDDRLRDLILFLNENSKFEVLAVEADVYKHEGSRIVVPRLFGAQTRKRAADRGADAWTADEARSDLKNKSFLPEHQRLLEWMLDFADRLAAEGVAKVSYGSGADPSVFVETPRSTVLRFSPARAPSELSVSFPMVHWKGDQAKIEAALRTLSDALGQTIEFQPARKVSVTTALIGGLSEKSTIEARLRELIAVL